MVITNRFSGDKSELNVLKTMHDFDNQKRRSYSNLGSNHYLALRRTIKYHRSVWSSPVRCGLRIWLKRKDALYSRFLHGQLSFLFNLFFFLFLFSFFCCFGHRRVQLVLSPRIHLYIAQGKTAPSTPLFTCSDSTSSESHSNNYSECSPAD